jgi:hypothetical protein
MNPSPFDAGIPQMDALVLSLTVVILGALAFLVWASLWERLFGEAADRFSCVRCGHARADHEEDAYCLGSSECRCRSFAKCPACEK